MQHRKNSHDSAAYSFCGSYALFTSASRPSFITPPLTGAPLLGPPVALVPPPLHAVATRPRSASSPTTLIECLIFPPPIPPPSREPEDRAPVVRCLPFHVYVIAGLIGRGHFLAVRGSSASRSPSPTRLNASVIVNRTSPGNSIIHQATVKIWLASDRALPRDGVVSGTPTPR